MEKIEYNTKEEELSKALGISEDKLLELEEFTHSAMTKYKVKVEVLRAIVESELELSQKVLAVYLFGYVGGVGDSEELVAEMEAERKSFLPQSSKKGGTVH